MSDAAETVTGPLLVRTKLHPPVARGGVPRPGLVAELTRQPAPRLALLRAPAGAGKTTLLAEWAACADEPRAFGWLALDAGDNDSRRFWAYAIEALRSAAPAVGDLALELLPLPGAGLRESILPALVNDLAERTDPVVLVLDDYHVIREQAIHDSLAWLVEHGPDTLEVAIASRSEPPLPVSRLRARGELVELDARGLRFSLQEAEELLNAELELGLDPGDVASLWERTEGWAAGLYLAALSVRGRSEPARFVADFAGDDRHVVDYLGEEVLAELPAETRDFLLRTSILERLSAGLCDAVLQRADSAQRLAELERDNLLLVPLDERREWYRYHHLFAELLRLELEQVGRRELAELHLRAAAWHCDAGLVDEAIRHFVAAGKFDQAGEQIALHYSPAVQRGEAATAARWLDSLPAESVRADARLCVARVITTMSAGGHGESTPWIEAAAAASLPAPFRDGFSSIESAVAVCECMLAMNTGDTAAAIPSAARAEELEMEGGPWHAVAVIVGGTCRFFQGDFAGAKAQLERGIALARATGVMPMPQVFALGHLAFMAAEQDDWAEAERRATESLELAAASGLAEHWASATAHTVLGSEPSRQPDQALKELRRGAELARRGAGTADIAHSLLALAVGERRAGNAEAARRALGEGHRMLAACPDPGIVSRFAETAGRVDAPARPTHSEPAAPDELSERELAVLRLLPTGLSQRELAGQLYVSMNTVKTHIRNIFRKLGVSGREEAVERARRLGLL